MSLVDHLEEPWKEKMRLVLDVEAILASVSSAA